MPIGPLAIAGITAGAQLAGTAYNAAAQGKMNRKTIKYNERMYLAQRRDALADWERTNAYNHPSAVMARYRDAGLNENLIYGSGTDATAAVPRSVDANSWNPTAPRMDFTGAAGSLMDMYDIRLKEAQTNNVAAQTEVAEQERLLKAAQVLQTTTGTERSKFDLGLAQELKDISMEAARAGVDKTMAETSVMLSRNEREAVKNVSDLREAVERILNMRGQRINVDLDSKLKQLDLELKKSGIQPGDPMWMRMLAQALKQTPPRDGKRDWWSEKLYRIDVDQMEKKAREFIEKNSRSRKK